MAIVKMINIIRKDGYLAGGKIIRILGCEDDLKASGCSAEFISCRIPVRTELQLQGRGLQMLLSQPEFCFDVSILV